MNLTIRKSKMISFRVSPEEYQTLKDTCELRGVRSISDLARTAMQKLIASGWQPVPLSDEVRDLRNRVRMLSLQLDQLSTAVHRGRGNGEEGGESNDNRAVAFCITGVSRDTGGRTTANGAFLRDQWGQPAGATGWPGRFDRRVGLRVT